MNTYPMHEKMRSVHDNAQLLGAFLEWLEGDGRRIAEPHEHGEGCEHEPGEPPSCGMLGYSHTGRYYLPPLYRWTPPGSGERFERILALYFDIDLDEISREKDAMLAEIRGEVAP